MTQVANWFNGPEHGMCCLILEGLTDADLAFVTKHPAVARHLVLEIQELHGLFDATDVANQQALLAQLPEPLLGHIDQASKPRHSRRPQAPSMTVEQAFSPEICHKLGFTRQTRDRVLSLLTDEAIYTMPVLEKARPTLGYNLGTAPKSRGLIDAVLARYQAHKD